MTEKKYTLAELYRGGQISAKVFCYKEIKDKVRQLTATGLTKSQAVALVAQDLGWANRSVYRAIAKAI